MLFDLVSVCDQGPLGNAGRRGRSEQLVLHASRDSQEWTCIASVEGACGDPWNLRPVLIPIATNQYFVAFRVAVKTEVDGGGKKTWRCFHFGGVNMHGKVRFHPQPPLRTHNPAVENIRSLRCIAVLVIFDLRMKHRALHRFSVA
jgi:hypothetical protein